jgi:hypothetical protein
MFQIFILVLTYRHWTVFTICSGNPVFHSSPQLLKVHLVTRHGVWIDNCIWLSKLITTINYNYLTNLLTLLFDTACTKSSQSAVFTSCSLVTAPNAADSLPSVFHSSCPRWLPPISQMTQREGEEGGELLYDWRLTTNHFIWVPSLLKLMTSLFFFNWTLEVIVLMQHPLWQDGFVSYEYACFSLSVRIAQYGMLLKIFPFALCRSPLSVRALQSRSCLSYVSYANTEA